MDTAANSQRRQLLVLLAWCLLLLLIWGGWLWQLDASDLTFDESVTHLIAHRPLLDILRYLRGAVREHPPVYYLLIHGWMALIGTGEFSLRAFSVCAGLVAVALTGWLARLIGRYMGCSTTAAGLLAAAFFAVAPGMVYYAREARMYSLGVVWTMLSTGLFVRDWLPGRLWRCRADRAALRPVAGVFALVAVHLLALFTHYYLLLPILVQPLVLLVVRRWRSLAAWCAAHSLLALVGLAWLRLAPGLQMTSAGLWYSLGLALPVPSQVLHLLGKLLFSPVVLVSFPLLYGLLALATGGVLLALWRQRAVGVWLALALLVPLALAYLLPHPPAPRYLVFLLPLVALAFASLDVIVPCVIRVRWLAWSGTLALALVTVGLLAAGGLYIALDFDRSRYGHTLETIKAHARPDDGLLFYGPWQWVQHRYYDPGGLPPITLLPAHAPPHLKPSEAEPVLEDLLARHGRLWVLPAAVDDVDPPHYVEGWLNTHTHTVWETRDFSLHLPPLLPSAPTEVLDLAFGQALRLERVTSEPQPVPAGEPLRLSLSWRPLDWLEDDVILTLTLVDQAGHVWDVDHTLPGKWAAPPSTWQPGLAVTDHEGLMVPQGAPPGEYTVRLMVGDEATGDPLPVNGEKETELLTVQVAEPIHPPVLCDLPDFHGLEQSAVATFHTPSEWHLHEDDRVDCSNPAASVTLAACEPGGLRFQQGHAVPLTLHWLVPDGLSPDVQFRVRAVHRPWFSALQPSSAAPAGIVTRTIPLLREEETAVPEPAPQAPSGPFQVMLPFVVRAAPAEFDGRLLTLPLALALPPDAPTGRTQVVLEVLGPDGSPWPTDDGALSVALFTLTVEGRPVLRRLPASLTPVTVDLGDEVGLRGYRVEGTPRPGGELRLTYAWHARTRPTAIYAVFNHLVGADGTMVAQVDGWPQEGRMLTTQWQAGEYIEDRYTLTVPPDAPPGPYVLYVGLYDAATAERQPAFQDGQRLPEDRVPIPLPGEVEP